MADDGTLSRILNQLKRAIGATPEADPVRAEQVAALVWRKAGKKKIEVLLITSRGTGRWILPKGWVEADEAMGSAAAREAWEEAGVEGTLSDGPVGTYDYDKLTDDGDAIPCRTHVFALAITRQARDWPERDERQRKWVPAADAAGMVEEPELKALLDAFATGWKKMAA
ncbi:MAG: NUDIX hydrolase [Roseitalea sp.]|jgi:8-oxo-dGTP pyrophosphatase MutT (NUDIX family)|nr:NUDIX hydrolase [Roseitalea sp.]MBO6723853.1 NUDIX hydrolase [Roseitalea sp.]MBO6745214.1 NUDIX hydrolase [Roseitalea sp.]